MNDHNHEDKRSNKGVEGRQTSEPQKAYLTGKFVIVEKFGDYVLGHLASSLSNVIRQIDR